MAHTKLISRGSAPRKLKRIKGELTNWGSPGKKSTKWKWWTEQHYPAAIGLEWQVHIPSRCVQQCGRWWPAWLYSQHVLAAGLCSAPDTADEVHSRRGRTPVVLVQSLECVSPRHLPGRSSLPGRRNTPGWCRLCSVVGPTTGVFPLHSGKHTCMLAISTALPINMIISLHFHCMMAIY